MPEPDSPQVQTNTVPPEEHTSVSLKTDNSALVGGIIWVVIIAGFLYFRFLAGGADILLNISTTGPVTASGVVTADGNPVAGGTLQVRLEDPRDGRHLASSVTEPSDKGVFRVDFPDPILAGRELRVVAAYFGKKGSEAIKGTATIYMNMTPPWSMSWSVLILLIPLVVLVVLFTGPLSPRKARLLFGLTYVVTFAACIIPVLLTVAVSQSRYLLDTMEAAPIGIVKAEKGVDKAQWLVNIGGAIIPAAPAAKTETQSPPKVNNTKQSTPADAKDKPTAEPAPGGANLAAAAPKGDAVPGPPSPPNPNPTTPNSANQATAGAEAPGEPQFPRVQSGLSIPLYVLILAMFGGAINMTRKVPAIQNDYDSSAAATPRGALAAPIAVLMGGTQPSATPTLDGARAAAIRRELIETYLYFISAPFLVIAVYYLLQVLANSVAEPVLVVIAFATGLMSDATVGAIMNFADSTLQKIKIARDAREANPQNQLAHE